MSSDIRDKNMIVQSFKNKGLRGEVIALISDDADYGLTREQIAKYADKKMDIDRMRIYSECLRNGYEDSIIKIIMADGLSKAQMQMALKFYKKGVPEEDIEAITKSGEKAAVMKKRYEEILDMTDSVYNAAETEPEYVKKIAEHIQEVVLSIGNTDKKFDDIAEVLKSLMQSRRDEEEFDKVLKENQEKDTLLSQKQDEINKAYSQASENRKEVEMLKEENETLKKKIREFEEKGKEDAENMTSNSQHPESSNREFTNGQYPKSSDREFASSQYSKSHDRETAKRQYPETSSQRVQDRGYGGSYTRIYSNDIERTVRRNSNATVGFFTRLGIKKKSRRNIVKLVIAGELDINQLVQIKSAIEKGLTERQLEDIINSRVPADRMKEKVEIAELENSMQG